MVYCSRPKEDNMLTERTMLIEGRDDAYIDVYARNQFSGKKRPAMLVIPGGAYSGVCSDREGEPIAMLYLAEGYNCFVLHYPCFPNCVSKGGESLPLITASRAVAYIKKNAERYSVNPDRIAAIGFSAGGHLAASLATMWNDEKIQSEAEVTGEDNRISAAILSYAVISSNPSISHIGSFVNLLTSDGSTPSAEKTERYSLENRVSDKTPPCFIWHTAGDTCVPVKNATVFAAALSKVGVPFELHIYPNGYHGFGSCKSDEFDKPRTDEIKHAESWVSASVKWLAECCGFDKD